MKTKEVNQVKRKAGLIGGNSILRKKGAEYFSKLAKKRWKLERQKKLSS